MRTFLSGQRLTLLVFLAQFGAFFVVGRARLVDGDEGLYLMTSRLAAEGKLPYHDFLWQQMPGFPYVYGGWMRLTGMTWMSARLLSAILAAAIGAALFAEVRRLTGRNVAGLTAGLLFVSSTLVFAWFTLAKTYVLSAFLLMLAYRAVVRASDARPGMWAVAGLLLGASFEVRLYFAGLAPVFLWWIWRSPMARSRARAILLFAGGLGVAAIANVYLLARDPQVFYFNNLGFHSIRTSAGLIGDPGYKLTVLAFLLTRNEESNGAQMWLLLFFVLVLAMRSGTVTRDSHLALTLGLALSLICLLPTPPFEQYFSVTVPFFILFAVCAMSSRLDAAPAARRGPLLWACAIASAMFVTSAIPDYRRFLVTGRLVTGILYPKWVENGRISNVVAVSRAIEERIRPGEQVMSLWPGYLFQTSAEPYDGLQNNAATEFADRLTAEQQARYHILSQRRILDDIAGHAPRLFVLGNQEYAMVRSAPFEEMLVRSGYRVVSRIGNTTLWLVDAAAPGQ